MEERQAKLAKRLAKLVPQMAILDAIRAELPEDGIFVDEVTQIGFRRAARVAGLQAAHVSLARLSGQSRLGLCHRARRAGRAARRAGAVDHRRRRLSLHRERDGDRGAPPHPAGQRSCSTTAPSAMCRRIQQEGYGNRQIASDLANPDFVKFAESFGAAAERARNAGRIARGAAARLRAARRPDPDRGAGRGDAKPWEFIMMPRVRGLTRAVDMDLDHHHDKISTRRLRAPRRSIPSSPSTPNSCARPPITRSFASRRWQARTKRWWSMRSPTGIDLQPFFELMANESVLKVFHAARQDIEIVWHRAKLIPHPIFDTQVAAMVLGYGDSVSYDQLVQRITGDTLDKSHRFTDWTRRPLTKAQIDYAISDVTHLRDVYLKLTADLEKRGRAEWVSEEMDVLTSPDTYRMEPENAWQRLRTRVRKPKELAVLIEVAAWREREAQGARRAARPRAQGRSGRRHRDAGADHDRAAVVAALAAQGLRAVEMGAGNSRSGQARPRARSEDAAACSTAAGRSQRRRDRRTAEGAAAHDRGAARRRRQGDRDRRRSRTASPPTTMPTCRR